MQYFFITGTSRGIGKALAERALREENTTVVGFSRQATLQHERYRHIKIDFSDIEQLKENVTHFFPALSQADRIVLINNAGTLGEVNYIGRLEATQLQALFHINVIAPAILMNSFMKAYQNIEAEKIIINVSSGAGKYPVDGWSGYCASKAALDMWSEVAALEQNKLKEEGAATSFKIFALAPGVVDTAMQETIRQVDQRNFSTLNKFLALKRNHQLDDAAQTAEKFFYLIHHAEKWKEVLQDVRRF